jgi:hypothetical protein
MSIINRRLSSNGSVRTKLEAVKVKPVGYAPRTFLDLIHWKDLKNGTLSAVDWAERRSPTLSGIVPLGFLRQLNLRH